MKRAIAILIALTCFLTLACSENGFPAKWVMMEKIIGIYGPRWEEGDHKITSFNGSQATITAVGQDLTFFHKKGVPYVSNIKEDEYILFNIPVAVLPEGSHIEIDAVIVSQADAPEYFIIEYNEGMGWKYMENDVRPVPGNPELKYSFKCSGLADGKNHEYVSVYQTIRTTRTLKQKDLKIRFRAVGQSTCSGKSGSENAIGFACHGYTGAYIQDYGTTAPKDTTDILCLGNSFTYFANAPSMLKEIAWSEGHYFRIRAHMKGGQDFGQHCSLKMTDVAINSAEYDFAFLQNQSQASARYASDKEKYGYLLDDCRTLCNMVRKKSPDCKIILESTWAYKGRNYGGFENLNTFETMLQSGSEMMSEACKADYSPIGKAFKIVYEGDSDINLYDTDKLHQSPYGTYLKSCVNYLMITGKRFSDQTSSCGLEPSKAKFLREAAQKAVFEN